MLHFSYPWLTQPYYTLLPMPLAQAPAHRRVWDTPISIYKDTKFHSLQCAAAAILTMTTSTPSYILYSKNVITTAGDEKNIYNDEVTNLVVSAYQIQGQMPVY